MQLNITESGSPEESFFFEPIPNKFIEMKESKQILTKWGLLDTLKIASFRFNQSFSEFQLESFLKDLFSNPNVRFLISNLKYPTQSVSSVSFEKLNCAQLSTEIFEKLSQNGVVNQDYISKTFSDQFEGIQICDKLRECLLVEQSDNYCIFNESQRKQFLFKIFQLLVIGGSLNQYEDNLSPYLQWTKTLYKNLVSVRKQAQSGNIFIDSVAVQIKKIEKDIFRKEYNPQTLIYVSISPSTRTVHIVSNQWIKFW